MKKQEDSELGARLNRLIARSGRTKASLAEHMGVSPQGVQLWIKSGSIARENIRPICEFIDASADELLGLRPIGLIPPSESHIAGLDIETLRSALAAIKEAAEATDVEIDDIFTIAPLIAFAYRERAMLPAGLTKDEYKAFDIVTVAKLKGEIRNVAGPRLVVGRGTEGSPSTSSQKAENRSGGRRR